MAEDTERAKRRAKIKREIESFKEKKKRVEGDPKITGVTKPEKRRKKDEGPRDVVVGPRGGRYISTRTGKKRYVGRGNVKKSLEEIVETGEKVNNFINKFKGENENG